MLEGRCDCGDVTGAVPGRPERINACPCAYCTRVGARWGYFAPASVRIKGATDTHRRASRTVDFHRCAKCGVLTHWIDPAGRKPFMGVHMANFDAGSLEGVPVVAEP